MDNKLDQKLFEADAGFYMKEKLLRLVKSLDQEKEKQLRDSNVDIVVIFDELDKMVSDFEE